VSTEKRFDWFGSRGASGRSFHVITSTNRYPSQLAGLGGTTVCKLVTPRREPAQFGCYLLEIEPGGGTTGPMGGSFEHFVYVLGGSLATSAGQAESLDAGSFVYVPEEEAFELRNESGERASALWIKRRYERLDEYGTPPGYFGRRGDLAEVELSPGFFRTELGPSDDPRYDIAMSVLRFSPGAGLTMVEIHEEEHALFMTAGGGVYFLEDGEHAVERDDFIYMAPFCPQSFRAGDGEGAEYLLYKGTFRDGF
jgi:(S)-ureidoglycine aminohydrolase